MTITKGIPIPPKNCGTKSCYPLREMKVGDSFLVEVPAGERKAKFQVALCLAARRVEGKKFTTRQVENGVRVWRVS